MVSAVRTLDDLHTSDAVVEQVVGIVAERLGPARWLDEIRIWSTFTDISTKI